MPEGRRRSGRNGGVQPRVSRAIAAVRSSYGAAVSAAAALVVLLLAVALPSLPTSATVISVDLAADTGATLALYVNDLSQPPKVQPLYPGARRTYRFDGPGGDITRLRVDVANRAGAQIRLYEIRVSDGSRTLARFDPADLMSWARYSLSPAILDGDALRATSTGPGANFDAFRRIPGRTQLPGILDEAVRAIKDPSARLVLMFVLVGSCCIGTLRTAGRRAVLVGAVAVLSASAALLAVPIGLSSDGDLASSSRALGRSTYLGLSLERNVRALAGTYVAALVVASSVLWLAKRRQLLTPPPTKPTKKASSVEPSTPSADAVPGSPFFARHARPLSYAAVASLCILLLSLLVPDLKGVIAAARSAQYPSDFDSQNLLTWKVLAARGLVPLRDFWYPYGNSILLDAPLVLGPVLTFALDSFIIVGYGLVFWHESARRLLPACLATAGLLLATTAIGEFRRYGLSLLVGLLYTTIDPEDRRWWSPPRVVFSVAAGVALFLEPALLVYAGVGIAALLAVDLFRLRTRGLRWWARRLAVDCGGPAIAVVLWIVVTAARGQLGGFVDFYLGLGVSAAYSAEPTTLLQGDGALFRPAGVVLWAPAGILAVGLAARVTARAEESRHDVGSRLLVVGGVAVLLLQKHAVRQVPSQLMLFPVLAVALVLLVLWRRRESRWALGVAIGAVATALVAQTSVQTMPDRIESLPSRVVADATGGGSAAELRQARAHRFDREHFSGYLQELAVADALRTDVAPGGSDLFVLGDAAILYVLLEQRPPWQINVYNTSPVADQRKVVAWLASHDPSVVVVDRRLMSFDDVPHQVRIPFVYEYVVPRYGLARHVGPFDVLRRLPSGAEPDVQYWRSLLSDVIPLGYAPTASGYGHLATCSRKPREACSSFLRLRRSPSASNSVEIRLRFGAESFAIRAMAAHERQIVIPLSSTWPFALSQQVQVEHTPPGWSAEIVRAVVDKEGLY